MSVRALTLMGIPYRSAATLDEAGLRAALESHHGDCAAWALACCAFDRSEAGDVLHDAYLKVLDGRAEYHGKSSVRTWLFGVVRRTAAERRRGILRRPVSDWNHRYEHLPGETSDLDGQIDDRALAERLRVALATLPLRQRQVLYLVFCENLTVEAAATIMDVSVGSARTHYARGKTRVRLLLNERPR